MKEYKIEIIEILSKTVKVSASNVDEACQKVKSRYDDSKIVLTTDDFVGTEFKLKEIN